jgi:hypothetical protein
MSDEKKETWLNWLAITTIIFSACSTLSSFRGSSFSTRAILAQSNAADQWAYYQAKSVKLHTYELHKDAFELEAMSTTGAQADSFKARIAEYTSEIARYTKEKNAISDSAKSYETRRTEFQVHGASFSMAVVYLQVAIMLSALSALMKKKPLWLLGSIVGCVGLVYFLIGIFGKVA